jgi:hypothetical protein
LAVAPEKALGPLELTQESSKKSRRAFAFGETIVNPLPLSNPVEQARLAQDFQVSRDARTALADRPSQIRDAQIALAAKREQAQAARLARGLHPVHQMGGRRHFGPSLRVLKDLHISLSLE